MDCEQICQNNHKFFDELKFTELDHKYTVRNRVLKSVSGLLPYFYEFVDWREKAEGVAFKTGRLTSEVLEEWNQTGDTAAKDGTAVHYYGEEDHKHRKANVMKEKAIDKFYSELPSRYVIIHKELRMWHKEFWYAGTTDLIIHDTWTNTDIIGDWKTNKDIHKNFRGKKLLHPFSDLDDSPLGKFNIQMNFYQLQYEQTGREVSDRWLIWLKEDGNYEVFPIRDYTARLLVWLEGKTFYTEC